jgi:hypothetical protein
MATQRGGIGSSNKEKQTMKMLFITTALIALSGAASADEMLKFRGALHVTAANTQDVGNVDGHTMGVIKGQGLALLPDGSYGQNTFVSTIDYIDGTGPFIVYMNTSFSDGSMIWYKGLGQATVQGKQTDLKVSLTVLGGKGKYAGTKGDGIFTATRLAVMPNAGAEIVGDVTLNLKTGDQADAAKAMLIRAAAAIKADREVALAMFNKGEGGFLQGDLYPFCYRMTDGKAVAGGVTANGADLRTVKDAVGKPSGLEIYAGGQKPEGQITEVTYVAAKFGTTEPVFPKVSFVTRVSDLVCGVGYYK